MVLYRLDQVPDENVKTFLQLLNGPEWTGPDDLDQAVRETVLKLREPYRAVTAGDFEELVLSQWAATDEVKKGLGLIQRVHCLPRRNLEGGHPTASAPGHISLVVVPVPQDDAPSQRPQPSEALCRELWNFLDERRLLTTRHHVVGPHYVNIKIEAELFLRQDALPTAALLDATRALADFFDPLHGGKAQTGWPFGRDVYVSEIYAVLNQRALVDYVQKVKLIAPGTEDRNQYETDGTDVIGVTLEAYELVGQLDLCELIAIDFEDKEFQLKKDGNLEQILQAEG
jgi:hypothetical protein